MLPSEAKPIVHSSIFWKGQEVVSGASLWCVPFPRGESLMTKSLEILLEAAKRVTPSPQQHEEQRRSFAYGNTSFENQLITREMIDRQAEAIARERNPNSGK
jgi:hypothetical protein